MNDDFLHQIRIDPPPRFIQALKARMDREAANAHHAAYRQRHRKIGLLALLGLGGLAAAFMAIHSQAPSTSLTPPPPPAASAILEPLSSQPPPPAVEVTNTVASSTHTAPVAEFRIAGRLLFVSSVQDAALSLKRSGYFPEPEFLDSEPDEAIAALCASNLLGNSPLDAVIVTRRLTPEELKDCRAQDIKNIAEVKLGYEAVVLARSKLYPAPKLTPQDIFLALAAQLPDPQNPTRWIKNTYTRWIEVNPALPDEVIDVLGPAAKSPVSAVFREMLLASGCAAVSGSPTGKVLDKASHDARCTSLRDDGIYHDSGGDMMGYLEANPQAIALLDYKRVATNPTRLVAASLGGIDPAQATLSNGSYAGSRTLYLYLNYSRPGGSPRLQDFARRFGDSLFVISPGTFIPLTSSERVASRSAASTLLSDVKP
jgi:phosphate transport system substrate-binding protein